MRNNYHVYIMTNVNNSVFYTGVTSDIIRRAEQHKQKQNVSSFTHRYNICKIVYIEEYNNIIDAIFREKQIKAGSRAKKLSLVESINPERKDLLAGR